MPHAEEPAIYIPDEPQCSPQPIRIIHVGMGASGLLAAHKARKMLQNYELVCYEKNETIGGTWWENRYPGCACDIPAHSYTFPFDRNTEWSGFYAYAPEIHEYMMNFYKKHNLEPFVVLNTKVVSATWDDLAGKWCVELERKDGSKFTDTCHVLINGSGVLTKWKWPDIKGLHDFSGTLAHSANWPQEVDWTGKKVAVIGTGSSSIQLVPQMAKTASHLTVFMRNSTWIAPQFGTEVTNNEADPDAMNPAAAGKHQYTEKEKQRFRDDPEYHLAYRSKIEQAFVGHWDMFYRGSKLNKIAKQQMSESMSARLGDREDIKSHFIPSWSPGCRRLTPGEGYLEALIRPNVTCVFDNPIERVTSSGVLTSDGKLHEVDILACATGFDVQFQPHFRVTGAGGQVMQDQPEPNIYASVAAPGFPNYFVINGPRGNWGQGCTLHSHETQMLYILQCARKMQEDRIKSMAPKQHVTDQLNQYMDAWHDKLSIWVEDCKSWYKAGSNNRVYLWPGSMLHHLKFMKRPRFEHYEITYQDEDSIFAFLGDGRTISQAKYGKQAAVPYIRNDEDTEWDIE